MSVEMVGFAGNSIHFPVERMGMNNVDIDTSSSTTQPLQYAAETGIFMQPLALRCILCSQRIFNVFVCNGCNLLKKESVNVRVW